MLLQVQGMIAEYERAKIMERCRRGKQHAARRGSVNVLSGATYGYRYIDKHEGGGEARYQVVAEEARVVQKIFGWVGQERCSIGEVCRRLKGEGVPTRTGKSAWDRSVVWAVLKNPAYKGTAAYGKTGQGGFKPQRLRPQRGRPEHPRRPVSRVDTSSKDQILIEVPGLVNEELFEAVQAQLEENRQRRRDRPGGGRYLLQGLVVCKRCGYGCYGKPTSRASAKGKGSPTPTTAARAPTPIASAASACAGISRSAPMCWTPPSGKMCVVSCPSPNVSGRSTSGGCRGKGGPEPGGGADQQIDQ